MEKVIIVRIGEIFLKGLNRPYFEHTLIENIRKSLQNYTDVWVENGQGRFYIQGIKPEDYDDVFAQLKKVFGIIGFCEALKVEKELTAIEEAAKLAVSNAIAERKPSNAPLTFKVEARRSDKQFPMNSQQLNAHLGSVLLDAFNAPGTERGNEDVLKVDVHKPNCQLNVEIRDSAYIHYNEVKGAGGMPVGTNGKATLLLSGGIDSPVAGYMTAKRGVRINAVHFQSPPYTSDRAKDKVIELAKILSPYAGGVKVFIVDFAEIQMAIYNQCPETYLTVIMRRFMMRIAERIARRTNSKALITGESIGQVASQTIDALCCTDAVVNMPVFRPVIGFDKLEIIDVARKIDTFETSILPYEDCCTVFVPKHPVIKPIVSRIAEAESVLDIDDLVKRAVENAEVVEV